MREDLPIFQVFQRSCYDMPITSRPLISDKDIRVFPARLFPYIIIRARQIQLCATITPSSRIPRRCSICTDCAAARSGGIESGQLAVATVIGKSGWWGRSGFGVGLYTFDLFPQCRSSRPRVRNHRRNHRLDARLHRSPGISPDPAPLSVRSPHHTNIIQDSPFSSDNCHTSC